MTYLHKHDADERGEAALVLALLQGVRVRAGHLFELDPLLAVLAGKVFCDYGVTLGLVVLAESAGIPGPDF